MLEELYQLANELKSTAFSYEDEVESYPECFTSLSPLYLFGAPPQDMSSTSPYAAYFAIQSGVVLQCKGNPKAKGISYALYAILNLSRTQNESNLAAWQTGPGQSRKYRKSLTSTIFATLNAIQKPTSLLLAVFVIRAVLLSRSASNRICIRETPRTITYTRTRRPLLLHVPITSRICIQAHGSSTNPYVLAPQAYR